MADEWQKINVRLLAYDVVIPTGLNMTEAINSLIDKLDEQNDALILCRELAAKGSKFASPLTRQVIEDGLVEIGAVIKKQKVKP